MTLLCNTVQGIHPEPPHSSLRVFLHQLHKVPLKMPMQRPHFHHPTDPLFTFLKLPSF